MPLSRQNMTNSSKVMTPAYPVLSLGIAAAYILGDPARTATPSFDAARVVMSVRGFGFVFLTVALIEIAGLLLRREDLYVIGLATGLGVSLAWAGFFFSSVVFTPNASLTGPQIWAFVAVAHFATFRSLTKDSSR